MSRKMSVKGLALDPLTNGPIIILRDDDSERDLHIWVGVAEANAIALELENISAPRPMTHDLLKNILDELGARVTKITVSDLRNDTFYAEIEVFFNGNSLVIDSRPSDAIALALRVDVPIFVEEEVLRKSSPHEANKDWNDRQKLNEWLEKLSPEDFGRYEM
jgi:uncharacterized protein